ncbi:hypothetical protein AAE478_000058 [Parahypoxylon ruwenzoriense]
MPGANSSEHYDFVISDIEHEVVAEKGRCALDAKLEFYGYIYDFMALASNFIQDDLHEALEGIEELSCLPILILESECME